MNIAGHAKVSKNVNIKETEVNSKSKEVNSKPKDTVTNHLTNAVTQIPTSSSLQDNTSSTARNYEYSSDDAAYESIIFLQNYIKYYYNPNSSLLACMSPTNRSYFEKSLELVQQVPLLRDNPEQNWTVEDISLKWSTIYTRLKIFIDKVYSTCKQFLDLHSVKHNLPTSKSSSQQERSISQPIVSTGDWYSQSYDYYHNNTLTTKSNGQANYNYNNGTNNSYHNNSREANYQYHSSSNNTNAKSSESQVVKGSTSPVQHQQHHGNRQKSTESINFVGEIKKTQTKVKSHQASAFLSNSTYQKPPVSQSKSHQLSHGNFSMNKLTDEQNQSNISKIDIGNIVVNQQYQSVIEPTSLKQQYSSSSTSTTAFARQTMQQTNDIQNKMKESKTFIRPWEISALPDNNSILKSSTSFSVKDLKNSVLPTQKKRKTSKAIPSTQSAIQTNLLSSPHSNKNGSVFDAKVQETKEDICAQNKPGNLLEQISQQDYLESLTDNLNKIDNLTHSECTGFDSPQTESSKINNMSQAEYSDSSQTESNTVNNTSQSENSGFESSGAEGNEDCDTDTQQQYLDVVKQWMELKRLQFAGSKKKSPTKSPGQKKQRKPSKSSKKKEMSKGPVTSMSQTKTKNYCSSKTEAENTGINVPTSTATKIVTVQKMSTCTLNNTTPFTEKTKLPPQVSSSSSQSGHFFQTNLADHQPDLLLNLMNYSFPDTGLFHVPAPLSVPLLHPNSVTPTSNTSKIFNHPLKPSNEDLTGSILLTNLHHPSQLKLTNLPTSNNLTSGLPPFTFPTTSVLNITPPPVKASSVLIEKSETNHPSTSSTISNASSLESIHPSKRIGAVLKQNRLDHLSNTVSNDLISNTQVTTAITTTKCKLALNTVPPMVKASSLGNVSLSSQLQILDFSSEINILKENQISSGYPKRKLIKAFCSIDKFIRVTDLQQYGLGQVYPEQRISKSIVVDDGELIEEFLKKRSLMSNAVVFNEEIVVLSEKGKINRAMPPPISSFKGRVAGGKSIQECPPEKLKIEDVLKIFEQDAIDSYNIQVNSTVNGIGSSNSTVAQQMNEGTVDTQLFFGDEKYTSESDTDLLSPGKNIINGMIDIYQQQPKQSQSFSQVSTAKTNKQNSTIETISGPYKSEMILSPATDLTPQSTPVIIQTSSPPVQFFPTQSVRIQSNPVSTILLQTGVSESANPMPDQSNQVSLKEKTGSLQKLVGLQTTQLPVNISSICVKPQSLDKSVVNVKRFKPLEKPIFSNGTLSIKTKEPIQNKDLKYIPSSDLIKLFPDKFMPPFSANPLPSTKRRTKKKPNTEKIPKSIATSSTLTQPVFGSKPKVMIVDQIKTNNVKPSLQHIEVIKTPIVPSTVSNEGVRRSGRSLNNTVTMARIHQCNLEGPSSEEDTNASSDDEEILKVDYSSSDSVVDQKHLNLSPVVNVTDAKHIVNSQNTSTSQGQVKKMDLKDWLSKRDGKIEIVSSAQPMPQLSNLITLSNLATKLRNCESEESDSNSNKNNVQLKKSKVVLQDCTSSDLAKVMETASRMSAIKELSSRLPDVAIIKQSVKRGQTEHVSFGEDLPHSFSKKQKKKKKYWYPEGNGLPSDESPVKNTTTDHRKLKRRGVSYAEREGSGKSSYST